MDAARMTAGEVDLDKLTIAQLKYKIRKLGGEVPPVSGKSLRQPYVNEVTRLVQAQRGEVVTLGTDLSGSASSSVPQVATTPIFDITSPSGEVETAQQVMMGYEEGNEESDETETLPHTIHQNDVVRIVGRDVPCRDPANFLKILQESLKGPERHTFRHITDDFVEKPSHQMSCCDCRYNMKYHSRTQRAGSSVMYCVQCSFLYRGLCRYVVCRDCRTSYKDKRAKARRLKRRLHEPEADEDNEDDDEEYVSNHEEILFDEWRRNRVRPFYKPWE